MVTDKKQRKILQEINKNNWNLKERWEIIKSFEKQIYEFDENNKIYIDAIGYVKDKYLNKNYWVALELKEWRGDYSKKEAEELIEKMEKLSIYKGEKIASLLIVKDNISQEVKEFLEQHNIKVKTLKELNINLNEGIIDIENTEIKEKTEEKKQKNLISKSKINTPKKEENEKEKKSKKKKKNKKEEIDKIKKEEKIIRRLKKEANKIKNGEIKLDNFSKIIIELEEYMKNSYLLKGKGIKQDKKGSEKEIPIMIIIRDTKRKLFKNNAEFIVQKVEKIKKNMNNSNIKVWIYSLNGYSQEGINILKNNNINFIQPS